MRWRSKIDKAFCRYPISFLSLYQNRPLYYWQTPYHFGKCLYSDWSRPRSTGNGFYLALAGDFVTKIVILWKIGFWFFAFAKNFVVVCKGDFSSFAFLCETVVKIFRDFWKIAKNRENPNTLDENRDFLCDFCVAKIAFFKKGRAFARFLKIFKNSTTRGLRSD